MNTDCRKVQEALVEHGGALEPLAAAMRRHVEGCATCAAVARAEADLARLLAEALPPRDALLTERILAEVRSRRRSRRLARLLPLAASLLLVLGAVFLLGGVPGSGLLAALPGTSMTGAMGLGGALLTWIRSLLVAARTLAGLVPHWLALAGLLVAVLGVLALRRLAAKVGDPAP